MMECIRLSAKELFYHHSSTVISTTVVIVQYTQSLGQGLLVLGICWMYHWAKIIWRIHTANSGFIWLSQKVVCLFMEWCIAWDVPRRSKSK